MKIALLSDLHIDADPGQVANGQNMADNLRQTVEAVVAERPDAVIVTGDIAYKHGEPAAYAAAEALLEPIRPAGIPLHLLVGNHDNAEHMRDPLDRLTTLPISEIVFVATNTQTDLKAVRGKMGDDQLGELDQISAAAGAPIIVLGHHQPEFPREDFKAEIGIEDTAEFVDLLDRSPNIKAYVHGHTHSWSETNTPGGTKIVNLPAVGFPFLNFAPDRPVGWCLATISGQQLQVELRALDAGHPEHGQRICVDI